MQLEEADPEFFEYLKQNDSSLLDFGENDSDEEDQEEDISSPQNEKLNNTSKIEDVFVEDLDDDDDAVEEFSGKGKQRIEVTYSYLKSILAKAIAGSYTSLRKVISILRAACIPSDSDLEPEDEDEDDVDDDNNKNYNGKNNKKNTKNKKTNKMNRFIISDPEIYEKVMTSILDKIHKAFYFHLNITDTMTDKQLDELGKHPKWNHLELLILSFFKSILHTLSSMTANISSGHVAVYLLSALEPYIILLSPMPRLAKTTIKVLLKLWSNEALVSEDVNNVRGHSFLRIRHIALALPGTIREECFRSIYLTFAKSSTTFTELLAPSVLFMEQSITELYAIDPAQAYQQAFLYIRQLALHLRAALMKKDGESVRKITSWQYLNCIRLWTRVLCAMPSEDSLGPLIYPLSQIMLGVMTAAPSFYYVPLRLHLLSCMQRLAAYSSHFIPTASNLIDILEHPDLSSRSTPSTDAPPKLQYLVKLPTNSATKATVRDIIVQETVTLLRSDAEIYRYHVAYPEYTYLTMKKLKNFVKVCRISRWRDLARALAGQLEQQASDVKKQREKLNKSPMDIIDFEPLRPSDAPKASIRLIKLNQNRGLSSIFNDPSSSSVSVVPDNKTVNGQDKKQNNKNLIGKNKDENKEVEDIKLNSLMNGKSNKKKDKKGVTREKPSSSEADIATMHDEVHALEWSDDED